MDPEVTPGTTDEPAPPATDAPGSADPETPAAAEPEGEITTFADVPPALKPLADKLQASFDKKFKALAAEREIVDTVKRYRSDPDFARQVIVADASKLGLHVTNAPATAPNGPATTPTAQPAQPTPQEIQIAQSQLPPELQFMAPAIAAVSKAMVANQLAPVVQQSRQQQQAVRLAEYDALAAELPPDWQDHQDTMSAILDFVRSDALSHPKFGNKLKLLHSMATGDSRATQAALERMATAGRQRTTTGAATRTQPTPLAERVLRGSRREGFAAAASEAIEALKRSGVTFAEQE